MMRSRPTATVHTHAAPAAPARAPAGLTPADRAHPDVAVVTLDTELVAALRAAARDVAIITAETPSALADLLLSGSYGVVVIDVPTLGVDAPTVLMRLASQFPDIPIVAVGTREEEALVGGLISAGQVYRYLHRPVSPERARTFLEAALRRHLERVPTASASTASPAPRTVLVRSRPKPRRPVGGLASIGMLWTHRLPALMLAAAAIILALALVAWLRAHGTAPSPAPRVAVRGALRAVTTPPAPEVAPAGSAEPVALPAAEPTVATPEPAAPAVPRAPRRAAGSFAEPVTTAPAAADAVEPATAVDLRVPAAPPDIGPLAEPDEPLPAASAFAAEAGPPAAPSPPATPASPPPTETTPPATHARPLVPDSSPPATETAAVLPAQIVPLVKIINVPPAYPLEARVRGTEGWVDVHFTVSPEGITNNLRVTNSSPRGLFDQAALDAVSRWRYAPRQTACEVDERVRFRFQ
jgi:protein TonB